MRPLDYDIRLNPNINNNHNQGRIQGGGGGEGQGMMGEFVGGATRTEGVGRRDKEVTLQIK